MFLLTAVQNVDTLSSEEISFMLSNRAALRAIFLSRILETRGGSATIHFDAEGAVRKIESVRTQFFKNT